jgi:hypothetical protein
MKKMKFLGIALIVLIAAFALTSCGFDGELVGTTWRYSAPLNLAGSGWRFETATTCMSEIMLLGEWGDVLTFDYTYDTATQTGDIEGNDFSIEGNNMTYGDLVYKYTPAP